ncbi:MULTISPECIES: septum site-determining protein MinC [Pseudoalteromonas]|jgi:septum site-determining protein MinC|uniref:Probable septum site-determining protein MinC n=2 Tax=Pseudoalteromonas TaxID=53246 RepID=A0AAD0U3D6_9GAMM|nr:MULTISPECIES: septum site-determining protein MinC [Pseudoalteromonas]MAJ40702.1 septum site-determining protein MinC [Pseudoalteromonadaceae bacterium]MCP4061458.1 septum site-determining protein MinC [Pseudoalteromonas sp.]MDC9521980.1 septum site-determining protein MinC [Pseudoalteromonas sp. Angola-31]MDY6886832.1 septum site-determining protein MinC [Pseudomonadota bacterium]OUX86329.1 MAG: septum site-determining protein MinC [Pseudoalteromonas sp. TMED43]GEK77579.1 putative septum |tara:strand:+ start:216 stop:923 length:708 start_codon:yes stop_codon:yes gene_type:complete
MSEQIFELKGNLFTLSVLHLYSTDIALLAEQLYVKIAQAPRFFEGAPIVVNLEEIKNSSLDFVHLKSLIERMSFNAVGVCNGSDEQHTQAKAAGLSVLNYSQDAKSAPVKQEAPNTSIVEKNVYLPAQVINGTVRSGQQVYAKDRDLIVLGAVSHGAEVIADGNVHIYGTLRGRAIAGAKGIKDACIYCQKLEAELVSIDGNYWISDSLQGEHWGNAVQIQQKNESLEISALVKG